MVSSHAVQCRLSSTPSSSFASPSHPCTCARPRLMVFHPRCPSISCRCFSAFFTSAGKPVSTYLFLGILSRIPVVSGVLSLSRRTRLKNFSSVSSSISSRCCSSSFSFLHTSSFSCASSFSVLFRCSLYSSSAALVMSCSFFHSSCDSSYPFHRTRYSVSPPSSRCFTTLSILQNPLGILLLVLFFCSLTFLPTFTTSFFSLLTDFPSSSSFDNLA